MTFLQSKSDVLLPKRFMYFAEGGGAGPSETFRPEAAGEAGAPVSEQAAEQAAEERRQMIAAGKQQRKEERKGRRRDHKLAAIIEFFIHGRDDALAILLARLLQRNTPVNILLATLSLNFPEVNEALEDYMDQEKDVMPDNPSVDLHLDSQSKALVEYGKELALALSSWTSKIFTHASFHPMKTIIALAHHHGVDHHMIQLTALMIQKYFQESSQEMEFSRIQEFSELFWRDALKRLHGLADERGLLPEPTIDRSDEEDDEDDEE